MICSTGSYQNINYGGPKLIYGYQKNGEDMVKECPIEKTLIQVIHYSSELFVNRSLHIIFIPERPDIKLCKQTSSP